LLEKKNALEKSTHRGKDNINMSRRDVGGEDGARSDRWSGTTSCGLVMLAVSKILTAETQCLFS